MIWLTTTGSIIPSLLFVKGLMWRCLTPSKRSLRALARPLRALCAVVVSCAPCAPSLVPFAPCVPWQIGDRFCYNYRSGGHGGATVSKPVKAYYWRSKPNFGDLLTPLLLRHFAHLDTVWAEPAQARLVGSGSVLDQLPEDWTGVVAGAGKLHEEKRLSLPRASILAVRGPLSARGLHGDLVLADLGLLADELVGLEEKQWNLGLIPHWTDTTLEHDPRFTRYDPLVIRVADDPLEVIRQIGRCKKIVSSSLHGIILADALAIPRRIEMAPRMLSHPQQEGGVFKWRDYAASLNMSLEIGLTQEANQNFVLGKQYELYDVLAEVKSLLR